VDGKREWEKWVLDVKAMETQYLEMWGWFLFWRESFTLLFHKYVTFIFQ